MELIPPQLFFSETVEIKSEIEVIDILRQPLPLPIRIRI